MRGRDRVLHNFENLYRESYARAEDEGLTNRMAELDYAYMRDQLLFEVLLDIRDLFSVSPADNTSKPTALEKLETLRRITKLR